MAPFVFLCECRDEFCIDYVKLTIEEYVMQRREQGFILCPGHVAQREESQVAA